MPNPALNRSRPYEWHCSRLWGARGPARLASALGEVVKVIKRVVGLPFQFGGEEHSGWLPPNAAQPLPTPIENVVLDAEIIFDGTGNLLCWQARHGNRSGDLWFETLARAEAAATEYFGIASEQWLAGGT